MQKPQPQNNQADHRTDVQIDPYIPAANDSNALHAITASLELLVSGESTELHLEQEPEFCRIRRRINGLLTETKHLSTNLINDLLHQLNIEFDQTGGKQYIDLAVLTDVHQFELSYYQTSHGLCLNIVARYAPVPGTLDQTRLQPESINTLRAQLANASNGITLYICNEARALRDVYYAMLSEANDLEHKVVSLESKIDGHIPRVDQIELSSDTDITKIFTLCSEHADRLFLNTGNIQNIEKQIIQCLITEPHSANLFISGSCIPHVLKQLASIGLFENSTCSYLNKIIEIQATRLICPHCADSMYISDRDQQWLDKNSVVKGGYLQKAFNTALGCDRCNQTGCSDSVTLLSEYNIDSTLIKSVTTTTTKNAAALLQAQSRKTSIRYQHELLARSGAVRFEDFRRSL